MGKTLSPAVCMGPLYLATHMSWTMARRSHVQQGFAGVRVSYKQYVDGWGHLGRWSPEALLYLAWLLCCLFTSLIFLHASSQPAKGLRFWQGV